MENLAKFKASSSEAACKRDNTRTTISCSSDAAGAVGGIAVHNTPNVSAHTSTWLAALHVNNNNNTEKSCYKDKDLHKTSTPWPCDSCNTYQKNATTLTATSSSLLNATLTRVCLSEEDEGGGNADGVVVNTIEKLPLSFNGSSLAASTARDIDSPDTIAGAATAAAASFLQTETDYDAAAAAYDMCGAVSLSPPLLEDHFGISASAGAGIGGGHSNRTSLNNSTENLSYISDNFYDDDLLLLEEDIDVEAEELSLNSDDCIYAYRGEGADFDMPLPPLAGVGGNFGLTHGANAADEETDFLEMDFEPDPLSELEYNQAQTATNYVQDLRNCAGDNGEQYLLQRDNCHLVTPNQRHQLFSSPIDDLPPANKALQAQSLLTKNFARITLHLDQIQKDYNDDISEGEQGSGGGGGVGRERLNSAMDSRPSEEEFASDVLSADTSHSLPNTLHEHFTNRCNSESAVVSSVKDCSLAAPLQTLTHKSPSKITGAKPKRLSTFSSTSSTSSKNSSKSRNSLRSAFQSTNLGNSCSFDERSVSCSEFRTERDLLTSSAINKQPLLASAPHTAPSTAAILNPEFNAFSDETCLDCLEKEFLANTIGKALDPQGCLKCRKRLGHLSLYNNTTRSSTDHHSKYRRSASPTTTFFFSDQPSPTSRLFSCEFLNSQARKRQEWDCYVQEHKEHELVQSSKNAVEEEVATKTGDIKKATKTQRENVKTMDVKDLNQSLKNLETKLLKNLKPPDPCSVTVSTLNLTETCLVQALDKLQISYNQELLRKYFKNYNNNVNYYKNSSTNISKTLKEFQNLKDFLMFVSKRQNNYLKLQRIIGKATQKQILVQFKKDPTITSMEMVTVRVSDILYYWSQHKNLDILKEMDKRYQDSNILGKIANIIRQTTHQRSSSSSSSSRRSLPEFISIPQYYPSGFLTLTKQC